MAPAAVIHLEQGAVVGITEGDALAVKLTACVGAAVTEGANVVSGLVKVPVIELGVGPRIALGGKFLELSAVIPASGLGMTGGGSWESVHGNGDAPFLS